MHPDKLRRYLGALAFVMHCLINAVTDRLALRELSLSRLVRNPYSACNRSPLIFHMPHYSFFIFSIVIHSIMFSSRDPSVS